MDLTTDQVCSEITYCLPEPNQRHTLVFALFNADVRVIDVTKQEAIRRLLLKHVVATGPGEKLDEKLAMLSLVTERDVCELNRCRAETHF